MAQDEIEDAIKEYNIETGVLWMPVSEIIKKTSVNKTNVSLGLKKLFKRGKVEKKDIKRVIMTKNGPYPRRTAHYKIK